MTRRALNNYGSNILLVRSCLFSPLIINEDLSLFIIIIIIYLQFCPLWDKLHLVVSPMFPMFFLTLVMNIDLPPSPTSID